jgi:hypothetical protein
MTFLELCQKTAADSGTVFGTLPTTVVAQTGRLGRIVGWVQDAYTDIQRRRDTWNWMQAEFEEPLIISQQSYAGSDFSLTRLDRFRLKGNDDEPLLSIYDPDIGVSDEGFMIPMEWRAFRNAFLVGGSRSTTGKPTRASVSPSGDLYVFPTPDKAYKIHGTYSKTLQTLSVDADVPEMPARFHDLIKWQALLYLGEADESLVQIPLWLRNYNRLYGDLEDHQLPEMTLGGPLA